LPILIFGHQWNKQLDNVIHVNDINFWGMAMANYLLKKLPLLMPWTEVAVGTIGPWKREVQGQALEFHALML
jgi:hypothetical protein